MTAEIFRVTGQIYLAIDFYDLAIAGAKENGYIQEEALSNELAAKFYLDWGKEKIAQVYLQEAYYCYNAWGAKAKIEQLEKCYPEFLASILKSRTSSGKFNNKIFETNLSSSSITDSLDFINILKALQTLSSEIQVNQLVCQLTQVMMEYSGAEKASLLRLVDGNLMLETIANVDEGVTLMSLALEDSEAIPITIINYVKHSLQTILLDDATAQNDFIADLYLIEEQPKSVLCTPILYHSELIGLIYLENKLTIGAFTPHHLKIIQMLCTQAAISLENAQLYQQSQTYVQQLENSLNHIQENSKITAFRADVDITLIQNASLRTILQQCTEAIVKHLDAAFARIWILNSETQILELEASAGMYTHINGLHGQVPVGKFKIGLIAEEKRPHLTNQVQEDLRVGDKEWAKREGMVAFAGYPIMLDQQCLGVVAMFSRQALSTTVLDSLRFAASEIALGINRKLSEKALLESENQLRQKAQELETTLNNLQQAQMQLIQSEKMSSLGNLVAGVAHEINNPIAFIKGSFYNLEEYIQNLFAHIQCYQENYSPSVLSVSEHAEDIELDFLTEDLPKVIKSMKMATERITDISNSLRTFSRNDSSVKVSCHLHEGIESTLLILKYRLQANDKHPAINIIREYGKLPPIKCFLGQLNQVFMNIIANAIDALEISSKQKSLTKTQTNSLQIRIQTELSTDEQTVLIRIKDNGIGISEEVKNRIFEHLFTTKEVGKGTGLGLAIARQIVEETHGGKLTCNSVVGEGTEFMIQLPIN